MIKYPMLLDAPCKDYLWGGNRLREEYGKVSDKDKIAESWELSCHKDGESVIANGELAGKTLTQYIEEQGKAVLGKNCEKFENFPILIKLIDAKDNLSVQVHPNNEYAMRVEGEYGKTEMWYIVDCDPGAELIYGFKGEISRDEFKERIANNTLLEVTNNVPVHKGDVFFIEAGTLHAIGKGILIAEIQQNSNTTYRVYDYGRVGADGKPRQLHVEKAVEYYNNNFNCSQGVFTSFATEMGMDEKVLKRTITSSATFTLLPSISILLGVIALSGTLGIPFSWLRLSVIGSLQYELNVAEIAAQSIGLSGLRLAEMDIQSFVTIALVMTIGILGGLLYTIFFLKPYLKKIQSKPKKESDGKPGFGAHATTAMFIGLCGTFIGAYVGKAIPREGSDIMPLLVAMVAAAVMAVFEYFIQKKGKATLENFSLAASMLIAMAAAVLFGMIL